MSRRQRPDHRPSFGFPGERLPSAGFEWLQEVRKERYGRHNRGRQCLRPGKPGDEVEAGLLRSYTHGRKDGSDRLEEPR